jgi:hypothetical protein
MAKSDLLKQAIADANTVRETALANAKIALQEAFAPRIQRVLATSLREELEGEDEEVDAMAEPVAPEAGAEEMGDEAMGAFPDSVNVGLDFDDDGEYDLTGMVGGAEEEEAMPAAGEEMPANPEAEYDEAGAEELDLESIIRELEGDLENEGMYEEEDDMMMPEGEMHGHEDDMMEEDIDSIIEAILREEDYDVEDEANDEASMAMEAELHAKEEELQEAYRTVKKLSGIINEVNLLNAKLLYTNKLFRNFELSENQKMKVIENFDRAGNTREVKLVFTTLAESFKKPTTKKRVVKESYASKPVATTAPSPRTISTQVLSEGFEMAERWKKLAGLL